MVRMFAALAASAVLINAADCVAAGPIDLDVPGNLAVIERDRPDHYMKIQRILAEASQRGWSEGSVATWLRTEFNAQEIRYTDLVMTSFPPKKRLEFSLDATSYVTVVTLAAPAESREAIQAYTRAARGGDCQAARRLGEIYQHSDIVEATKWYNAARMLGCDVPAARQK